MHPAAAIVELDSPCPRTYLEYTIMELSDALFIAYLEAKRSVDDRSLHPRVWAAFIQGLEELRRSGSLEAAELGAGIGTMYERVFSSSGTAGIRYHLVDENPMLLETAGPRILASCFPESASLPDSVQLHTGDAVAWLNSLAPGKTFQALLANAFLDLVDIPLVLDKAFGRLSAGGLAYLTINYEGLTDFIPALESDQEVLTRYNDSMRGWKGSYRGTDKSGNRILEYLLDRGYPILDAGASDWVVTPRQHSTGITGYTREEGVFLRAILAMVEDSVSRSGCDPALLSAWLNTRRKQVEEGTLVYIAHQLDVLSVKR